METERPLFEVRTPDGHEYRIWYHGHVEGFPPNSIIMNRAPVIARQMVAEAIRDGGTRV